MMIPGLHLLIMFQSLSTGTWDILENMLKPSCWVNNEELIWAWVSFSILNIVVRIVL
jgi:hypothetical protein